jgi:N-acetyl sugar amidotransferase
MKNCKKCLYSENHALNIIIDDDGICSGCKVHEEKNSIDWDKREDELKELLNQYRNVSGNNYDCIIPVSGGKDSFFIVDTIKNKFKMNPLLVTYNKQYNTAVGFRNLTKLKNVFDCDIMTLTVDPNIVKNITRASIRRLGSIYWHCIAGQTVFPVNMAVKLKIPLIIWGAHQGVDQVGMFSHYDYVEMTRKYRKEHDLMGLEAEDLVNEDLDQLKLSDVKSFIYPDDSEIQKVGVRGIYLNNYIRWDSKKQHELMISKYNYETAAQTRTFDNYNDIDCFIYSDLHDYLKLIKHGYGKVIDHLSREIRFDRLTRQEALIIAKKYQFVTPKSRHLFLEWMGITDEGFNYLIDQFRNKKFWFRDDSWKWKYFDYLGLLNAEGNVNDAFLDSFLLTDQYESTDSKESFILIGKGC